MSYLKTPEQNASHLTALKVRFVVLMLLVVVGGAVLVVLGSSTLGMFAGGDAQDGVSDAQRTSAPADDTDPDSPGETLEVVAEPDLSTRTPTTLTERATVDLNAQYPSARVSFGTSSTTLVALRAVATDVDVRVYAPVPEGSERGAGTLVRAGTGTSMTFAGADGGVVVYVEAIDGTATDPGTVELSLERSR